MVESSWNVTAHGVAWLGGGEGETGEWSGYPVLFILPRNMVYPTLLPLMRTPLLSVVNWTDPPSPSRRFKWTRPFRLKTKSTNTLPTFARIFPYTLSLLTLQGDISNTFLLVTGQSTRGFYFRLLTNSEFLKISLNFSGKKSLTTWPKVANFFTTINHKCCKDNAKQFPNNKSSHSFALSRPERHG